MSAREHIPAVRNAARPARIRSVATLLGLITASVVCLCAGALLAVRYDGLPRVLFALFGFAAYLYFSAHALLEINLPRVLVEREPDPERWRQEAPARNDLPRTRPVAAREARRPVRHHGVAA